LLEKLVDRLFIPNEGETIGLAFIYITTLLGVGCLFILGSLNFPPFRYIKKHGVKCISFKKLFKEAGFREKWFTILGIYGIVMGVIRGTGILIYYIIHWHELF
jgi:hypothetical protein